MFQKNFFLLKKILLERRTVPFPLTAGIFVYFLVVVGSKNPSLYAVYCLLDFIFHCLFGLISQHKDRATLRKLERIQILFHILFVYLVITLNKSYGPIWLVHILSAYRISFLPYSSNVKKLLVVSLGMSASLAHFFHQDHPFAVFAPILSLAVVSTLIGNIADFLKESVVENQRNQAFIENIIRHLPHMIFVKDAQDLRFMLFNKAGEELLGIHQEELLGKNDFDFFPQEQAKFFQEKDRNVLMSKRPVEIPEEPVDTFKGRRWLNTKKIPILDDNGFPLYLLGISEDITAKREKEFQIKRQREILNNIVDHIPLMLLFFNEKGICEWGNKSFEQISGRTLNEIKNNKSGDLLDLIFPDGETNSQIRHSMFNPDKGWKEFPMINRQDQTIPCLWTFVRISDGKIIGIGRDVSEEKRLQQEIEWQRAKIVQSSRLSALGEMAGNIAHEINNPLTVIQLQAHRLIKVFQGQKDLWSRESIDQGLDKILQTIRRISDIVHGLRNFSREGCKDPLVPISLNKVIEDAIGFCKEKFRNQSITLEYEEPKDDIRVNGREIQLSQVLLNLLNNARNAVSNCPDKWVRIEVREMLDFVEIQVIDSGKGIPLGLREKIFEPFFTTKEVGEGTGLGLSISKGIIEDHGGKLTLGPDCGNTCFVISLSRLQGLSESFIEKQENSRIL